MNRKLIALGLLCTHILVSTSIPSIASATVFNFNAGSAPATLTGNQHGANVDVFTFDAGTVSCTKVTYEDKELTFTPSGSITLTFKYEGCTAFGFASVSVGTTGCRYRFEPQTKEGANYEGVAGLGCTGSPVTITSPGCTVTVGTQALLKNVTYTNVGAAETREVTVDVAIEGIKYEEHNKGIFPTCAANTVPKNNGKYIGAALVTGEKPGTNEHVGVFVE